MITNRSITELKLRNLPNLIKKTMALINVLTVILLYFMDSSKWNTKNSSRNKFVEIEKIQKSIPPRIHHDVQETLPLSFDSREHWNFCRCIGIVPDQGSCLSGWAYTAVSVMNDRLCIHSNGTTIFNHSVQDLLTCCSECGSGCSGGYPGNAWDYWKMRGIVSGGQYGSNEGCKPYTIPPCGHSNKSILPKCEEPGFTPMCEMKCQSGYPKKYKNDRQRGGKTYGVDNDEQQIRYEIWKNGPVQATMLVQEDFLSYDSGIYENSECENAIRLQSVKIIGWGEEGGIPYWLCINSWNTDWGDNGYFKIKRGSKECRIEEYICAGIPRDYSNSV